MTHMLHDYGHFARVLGGFLTIAGALCASGLVPRNPFFGVRLVESFASPDAWRISNRVGGLLMLRLGIILSLAGWLLRGTPAPNLRHLEFITIVFPLLPTLLTVALIKSAVHKALIHRNRDSPAS